MIAGSAQMEPLVALLASTFQEEPVAAWMFPDPDKRRAILPAYFQVHYRSALEHGMVYATEGLDAVALTVPSGRSEVDESRLSQVAGDHAERALSLVKVLSARRPARPHTYLSFAAVGPDRWTGGTAAALLREIPKQVYLEAASAAAETEARRHGFVPIGEPIELPGGPSLCPMWREHTP